MATAKAAECGEEEHQARAEGRAQQEDDRSLAEDGPFRSGKASCEIASAGDPPRRRMTSWNDLFPVRNRAHCHRSLFPSPCLRVPSPNPCLQILSPSRSLQVRSPYRWLHLEQRKAVRCCGGRERREWRFG